MWSVEWWEQYISLYACSQNQRKHPFIHCLQYLFSFQFFLLLPSNSMFVSFVLWECTYCIRKCVQRKLQEPITHMLFISSYSKRVLYARIQEMCCYLCSYYIIISTRIMSLFVDVISICIHNSIRNEKNALIRYALMIHHADFYSSYVVFLSCDSI